VTSSKGPARGTRILNGRYYRVRAEGSKRIWSGPTKGRTASGVLPNGRAL